MPGMLTVRTVRVVFTCVIAAGRDGCPALVRYAVAGQGAGVRVPRGRPRRCARETVMRVAIRWGTAALTAGALAAGLVMSLAPAGAAAASTVTAPAGRAAGLAEISGASALVPGPSCWSATMCLAVASFAQGNTSSPVLTGELWNGTS